MEAKTLLINIMLHAVLCTGVCLAATLNSSTDESSLLAIKARITSDPDAILSKNWSSGTSFCTWIGVTCGRRHVRATRLDLFAMHLQGTIAEEIGSLSFLRYLDMSNNSFSGLIPDTISNLGRLRFLNLGFNQLNGNIPPSLGLLRNLVELDLSGNHLVGTIPWSIFNLSLLVAIDLSQNQLSGTLPLDICLNAAKLISLRLSENQLAGNILESLSKCSSLEMLYIYTNNFTGSISREIGNLTQLQELVARRNQFTGTIPASIGNLSNLLGFDIGENSVEGPVPSEIGLLTKLTWLNLQENNLIGELPQSIFNLSNLQTLSLAFNQLSGQIPPSIGKLLPNLDQFLLGTNQFYGKIPDSISNISSLSRFSITNNSFSGLIPTNLGNLLQLQILGLGQNQFNNNLSEPGQEFLTSLTNCKYLSFLDVGTNPISGVLPKSLVSSNLSASLQTFLAFSCQISGTIPVEYGNLSSLSWLNFGFNELTGEVPGVFGQSLQMLQLDRNYLEGSIPDSLCNLENLYHVGFQGNRLSGRLPTCLGSLAGLREIDLGSNAFTSGIPTTFWLNEVIQTILLDGNFFDGSLPQDMSNMKSLIQLDLSGNQLSGGIPSTIGELQNLNVLMLSFNNLNGSVPDSFGNLKDLQQLDLSHNNLSGAIPRSLETIGTLYYLNVSFNELSGEIPDGGPFANFSAGSFTGNSDLCGASRFNVQACKLSTPKPSPRKNRHLKYIVAPVASIAFVAIVLILFITYRSSKSLLSSVSDLPLGLLPRRISYYEILRATSNLDEQNLIGRGSLGLVYKVAFSDVTVAIKVFNLDVQGALKSFDTECQIMRSIRHRNLVKVVTSCSNLDFKALVMAYMPNGNLDGILYSSNMPLNISQRLGIMIDVASAMEYLHQGYSSPIIHCDLKPTNILLDEDMVAHVGDFGIAKLLTEEQRMMQTKTLGTIGYMAPEYGLSGLVSTKVDVYSYGILLMETFTRKKPTDEMFSEELTMKSWVSEFFPDGGIMQIVDADLLNENEENGRIKLEKCLRSIMGLALECVADSAEERPNMKDVLVKIKKIKTEFEDASTRGR